MAFEQPKLPYALDALEPILSKRQVDLHYSKHMAKYFDVTNKLIKGTVYEKFTELSDLLTRDMIMKLDSKLFNNAAQAWNHVFYFESLCPKNQSGKPSEAILAEVNDAFGSFETFKKQFVEKAVDQFGSGWAWLIWNGSNLKIKTTPNARNPLSESGDVPILTIDVWEHAYLYDEQYAADRKTYVQQIFDIINWEVVNQRFEKAQ